MYLEEVTIHDPRVKEEWIGVIRGQRKVDTLIMDLNDGWLGLNPNYIKDIQSPLSSPSLPFLSFLKTHKGKSERLKCFGEAASWSLNPLRFWGKDDRPYCLNRSQTVLSSHEGCCYLLLGSAHMRLHVGPINKCQQWVYLRMQRSDFLKKIHTIFWNVLKYHSHGPLVVMRSS